MNRGQALVEFALVMVVALFAARGFAEAAFLFSAQFQQDRATGMLAEWIAHHPGESWTTVADHALPGCQVTVSEPLPGIIHADSTCHYHPVVTPGLWEGLPISSDAEAAR